MRQKLTALTCAATLFLMMALASPLIVPSHVYAAAAATASGSQSEACSGLSQLTGGSSCTAKSGSQFSSTVNKGIRFLSEIVGIIAGIMIIVGGFRYITSAGDAAKVGKAKTTLVYAVVGLIIAALAQFLANFVLTNA